MTEPMTDARLGEIEALAAAATPGPWTSDPDGCLGPQTIVAEVDGYERMIGSLDTGEGDEAQADQAFVLTARTAVPELVAEVRRLRAENGRLDTLADNLANALNESDADAVNLRTDLDDMRLSLDQANDVAYGKARVLEIQRIEAIQAENAAMKPLLVEATTEIEWLADTLNEHALYEDAVSDVRALVVRIRARLAAKGA